MISLSKVLALENTSECSGGLPHAFGDSFLLRRSRLYRIVRIFLLEHGYRFTDSGELADLYRSMPLLTLPIILRNKEIPYVPNGKALRRFENLAPGAELPLERIGPLLGKNELLHESAHCVAECTMALKRRDNDSLVLRALMAESFANSVETIVAMEAESELDRWFLQFHTVFTADAKIRGAYRELTLSCGNAWATKAVILAFLRANFLREDSCDPASWLSLALGADAKNLENHERELEDIFQFATNLSKTFRTETSQVYFSTFYHIDDIRALLARVDFHELMNEAGREWLEALVLVIS